MTNPNDPNQPPGGYGPPPPPGGGYGPPPGGDGGYGPPPGGGGGYGPPPGGGGGYGPPPGGGGGYGPPPGGGYGGPPPAGPSNGPMIMGIIGIVTWFCCPIASVVLGLIGQSQATKNGQPATLPRIAWIGGIVFIILNVVYVFAVYLPNRP